MMSVRQKQIRSSSKFSSGSEMLNYQISINSLLVWIFCLENQQQISETQKTKICNLYGRTQEFMKPLIKISYLQQALGSLQKLHQQRQAKYVPKLCISMVYLRDNNILKIIKNSSLIQVCVVCSPNWQVKQLSRITQFLGPQKHLNFTENLNQVLEVAIREVQNFTKSFRTFHNSMPLVKQTIASVNLYRYRLFACIHSRESDQELRADKVEAFALQKFNEIKNIGLNNNQEKKGYAHLMNSKQILFTDIFHSYKTSIVTFNQNIKLIHATNIDKQEKQKQIENQNRRFWHKIIDIYQQEGFFYQIVNNYLRIFKQPHSHWEPMAQPISYLYRSIKGLYSHYKQSDAFYRGSFTVYRGGRVRSTEIQELTKTAIRVKESAMNKIQFEEIIKLLRQFQNKSVDFGAKFEELYVEFFGFMSTTLCLKKAISNFLYNKKHCDQATDPQKDYGCIFKIDVNNHHHQKRPDCMNHGYYKFSKEQAKGDTESEVLFNALNVFKLKSIQLKTINKDSQLIDYEDPQSNLVYFIELEYGSFQQMVFQKSFDELSQYQKLVRLNYCSIYRKVVESECFDIADAYEATNELLKSQKYYEGKLLINDSIINDSTPDKERFQLCQKDNKNYMLSLSRIYDKRGKTLKAIQALKLVIKAYEFLQKEGDVNIYLKHMQRISQMQQKVVDLVQKTANLFEKKQFLKMKKKQISKQYKDNETLKELKYSEIDIAEGVLQFQKGELEQSIRLFRNVQKSTSIFFRKIKEIKSAWFIKQYLQNLFCCGINKLTNRCLCKYSEFLREMKQFKLKQAGGQDENQFDSVLFRAIQLYLKAVESIQERMKKMKSPQQFKKIIERFNHQISLLNLDVTDQLQVSSPPEQKFIQTEIQDQIKSKMRKIKNKIVVLRRDRNKMSEKEITEKKKDIVQLINKYNILKSYSIADSKSQNQEKIFEQFVEFFYKQERLKKLSLIRQKILKADLAKTIVYEQLQQLTGEIQNFILRLKQQNYSESNIQIIQSRIDWAKIALQKQDYCLAKQQISLIVNNGNNEIQVKFKEMAKAHKINGELQLKIQNYRVAIQEFSISIQFQIRHHQANKQQFYHNERIGKQCSLKDIVLSQQTILLKRLKNLSQYGFQNQFSYHPNCNFLLFTFNNNFLQAQILKCKAQLYLVYRLKIQFKKIRNKYINDHQLYELKEQLSKIAEQRHNLLSSVKEVLDKLQKIFQIRQSKLKCGDLQVLFPEILGLYYLSQDQQNSIRVAFQLLKDSLERRDALYSQNNYESLIMCSQIIYCFGQNKTVFQYLKKYKFLQRIKKFMLKSKDYQNYSWKLQKALYYIQKYSSNNAEQKIRHLEAAIQSLKNLKQYHLQRQFQELSFQLQLCRNPQLNEILDRIQWSQFAKSHLLKAMSTQFNPRQENEIQTQKMQIQSSQKTSLFYFNGDGLESRGSLSSNLSYKIKQRRESKNKILIANFVGLREANSSLGQTMGNRDLSLQNQRSRSNTIRFNNRRLIPLTPIQIKRKEYV